MGIVFSKVDYRHVKQSKAMCIHLRDRSEILITKLIY